MSTLPSPYAAPNTPIASAKRPRIHKKDLKSPAAKVIIHKTEEDDEQAQNALNSKVSYGKSKSTVPPTPSKIMFSPVLRDTQHTGSSNSLSMEEGSSNDSSNSIERVKISPAKSEEDEVEEEEEEEEEEEVDEEEEEVFNPYLFIGGLPRHSLVYDPEKVAIPPLAESLTNPPMTLVLDLDETLVHCTVDPIPNPDLVFPVNFNGVMYQVYVRKRPYLDYFLETVSKSFEIIIFTASQKVYADVLLDRLDPERRVLHSRNRLFREACLLVQGNYIKDLHVIKRDMRKMLLVDNSPHAYAYQIDNGIPIESWYDDETDTELLKLIGFLRKLSDNNVQDVRPIVREHFKTFTLVENAKKGLPFVNQAPPF